MIADIRHRRRRPAAWIPWAFGISLGIPIGIIAWYHLSGGVA